MVLTINIPDAIAPRVLTALAAAYGYQDTLPTGPNPETRAQFAKRQVIAFIRNHVKAYEANQAAITARQSAESKVETEIALT